MTGLLQRVTGRVPINIHEPRQSPTFPDLCILRKNYFVFEDDGDSFSSPNFVDFNEPTRRSSERADIEDTLQHSLNNGLPENYNKPLTNLVRKFSSTSSVQFSSTPSKVDALRIELTP